MPTEVELTELQGDISAIVKPVLTMAGASNPLIASALFGMEMLFRFLSLGAAIRAAIDDQKKKLDDKVRTEDILRIPICVDTTLDDVLTFFVRDADFPILHPEMARQFPDEIETVKDPSSPDFPEALRVLDAARRVIPRVERELRFKTEPIMDRVFGRWLDPGKPDFRTLVYDFIALADKQELSLVEHVDRIPEYVRFRFRAARVHLNTAAEDTAKEVNAKIRVLIHATLFGDKGAIESAMKFAVDRRVELIDAEVMGLADRKAAIETKTDADRSDQEKQELKDIAKRIKELGDFKTRVNASVGV